MIINKTDLVVRGLTPQQSRMLAIAILMEVDCKIKDPSIRLEFLPAMR